MAFTKDDVKKNTIIIYFGRKQITPYIITKINDKLYVCVLDKDKKDYTEGWEITKITDEKIVMSDETDNYELFFSKMLRVERYEEI